MQTIRDPKGWWAPADAAKTYRLRHQGRTALRDGAAGAMFAGNIYAEEAVGAWMREAGRRAARGENPPLPEPLPSWVRLVLPWAREFTVKCGADLPDGVLTLLRDQFNFEQLMADPPVPMLYAQVAAFAASCRFESSARLKAYGELYRSSLPVGKGPYASARKMASDDLGAIATSGGRYIVELVRQADRKREPGRPVDVFTSVFLMGVASTYAHAQMGSPRPLDLAEIAVVWTIDRGPREQVVRRWNGKAEQFRKRMQAGKTQFDR